MSYPSRLFDQDRPRDAAVESFFRTTLGSFRSWRQCADGNLAVHCRCGEWLGIEPGRATINEEGLVEPGICHDDPKCGWNANARLVAISRAEIERWAASADEGLRDEALGE